MSGNGERATTATTATTGATVLSASRVLLLAAAILALSPALLAQDDVESVPLTVAGFTNTGSATAGYRLDDVHGYQPMFLELFGLKQGFRLQDFSLFGTAKENANPFADDYSVTLSGLGDPFETAQVTVKKSKVYDLRVNYRQSNYFWNQNDGAVLPIAPVAHLSTGLTTNHDWDTTRRFGSADLTIYATKNLRFNLDYYRDNNNGMTDTTRSMDFFDSPAFWGGFARGNAFYLLAPINDNSNRFSGGLDYTLRTWTFHYKIGYQTTSEIINLNNATSPEIGINGLPAGAADPLTSFAETMATNMSSPVSEFSYVGKPFANFDYRGGYTYFRYSGPSSLNESFDGLAPSSGGPVAPYAVSQAMRANVSEPNHIIHQGATYHIKPWWDLDVDYRYTRFTTNAVGNYQSIFNAGAPSTGMTTTNWRDGLSDLDITMGFTPFKSLVIRPGVHLMKNDVESFQDGISDPSQSLRTKTIWPEVSFGYTPSSIFSIRGGFHTFTNSASYTATTPHTEVGTRITARLQPIPKVSLENDLNLVNDKLIDTNFVNNVHSDAITLSYAYNPHYSVFAGFSYGSFFAAGNILYARGTAPLSEMLRDQEVNRVWQAGAEGKYKRFGMRVSANFVRSTGLGQIGSEPPAYGPITFPMGMGTIYYDFPKAGRLAVDLQRSYYKEQIVPVNNFDANLLMILWTRNF